MIPLQKIKQNMMNFMSDEFNFKYKIKFKLKIIGIYKILNFIFVI